MVERDSKDNLLHLLQEVTARVGTIEDTLDSIDDRQEVEHKIHRMEVSQTLQIHRFQQTIESQLQQVEERINHQIDSLHRQSCQHTQIDGDGDDDDDDEGLSYHASTTMGAQRQDSSRFTIMENNFVVVSPMATSDVQDHSSELAVVSSSHPTSTVPSTDSSSGEYDLESNEKFNEHPREVRTIESEDESFPMPIKRDMYSIMAITSPFTFPWCFSFCIFLIQVALFSMILFGQTILSESQILDIPPKFSIFVCISQFLALLVLVSIQDDIFDSIKMISLFVMDERKERNLNDLIKSGTSFRNRRTSLNLSNDSKLFWKFNVSRIIFPYFCKFIQGMLALVTSFIIVIQASDIISLFKDFAALSIISILDNSLFHYCEEGFLVGPRLQLEAKLVKHVRLKQPRNKLPLQHLIVTLLLLSVYIPWGVIVQGQRNYSFYKVIYPKCDVLFDSQYDMIGDGRCDGSVLNTPSCNFDGNDCLTYNIAYPECHAREPWKVGDTKCDLEYNVESCGYDGGDCCPYQDIRYGDGRCDGGIFNTAECLYDSGDCLDFNKNFPNCMVSEPWRVGDGHCDGKEFFNEACGWDGGDCDKCDLEPEDAFRINDGICDEKYNKQSCSFDGGDCELLHDFYIRNVETNMVIGVDGECNPGATTVTMQDFTASTRQRFHRREADSPFIYSKACEGKALDLSYSICDAASSKVEAFPYHGAPNQEFHVQDGGIIMNTLCGKALSPRGNETNSLLYVDENKGTDLQRWKIEFTESSSSPTISPTSTPTLSHCESHEMKVVIDLKTDAWPAETSWFLRNLTDDGQMVASTTYTEEDNHQHFDYQFCLAPRNCYEFAVLDAYDDGILLPGGYSFSVDDTLLSSSFNNTKEASFGSGEKVAFGSCNSTVTPTYGTATSIPSYVPSEVPSEFPSMNPTESPSEVPSEFPSLHPTDSPSEAPSEFPSLHPTKSPS